MLTLFQLKNRIAWEIQALKDRKKHVEFCLGAAGILNREANPELTQDLDAINERIPLLQSLHTARVATLNLLRSLPKLNKIERQQAKDELRQIAGQVRDLRAALAI